MSTISPFLDLLAPEIRLQIYSYILVAPSPIKGTIARSLSDETYELHTSILRTNRQIHNEAKHVFFGLNAFHITSAASLSGDESLLAPGSFEPPLQLRDLPYVRHLKVDLLYYPMNLCMAVGRDGKQWMPVCPGADRYATSIAFLLGAVKKTLFSLELVADTRPYTSCEEESELELEDLDVRRFLTGFCAADRNWRFRDALAWLMIQKVDLTFEFPESFFNFSLNTDVFMQKKLVVFAGQVLVARSEVRMKAAIGDIGPSDDSYSNDLYVPEQYYNHEKEKKIVVPWPLVQVD